MLLVQNVSLHIAFRDQLFLLIFKVYHHRVNCHLILVTVADATSSWYLEVQFSTYSICTVASVLGIIDCLSNLTCVCCVFTHSQCARKTGISLMKLSTVIACVAFISISFTFLTVLPLYSQVWYFISWSPSVVSSLTFMVSSLMLTKAVGDYGNTVTGIDASGCISSSLCRMAVIYRTPPMRL